MILITVFDSVSNTFGNPFPADSARDAIEGFRQAVNDENTKLNKHPTDFSLVKLGNFDNRTGELTLEKEQIATALSLLIPKES